MNELKRCPCCGGEPVIIKRGNDYTKRDVEIKCKDCRLKRINGAIRNSMEWLVNISIEAWNKRV